MAEVKRTDEIAGDIVHVYDDIEEADNALPLWWVTVFIGTLVFGAAYWLLAEKYHVIPTPLEALALEQAERGKRSGSVGDAELVSASQNASQVAAGKLVFTTNCVACHGAKAEGNIGPNLTDPNWLHGGKPVQIFATIRDGVPAKGMPSWGAILGQDSVKALAAYLLTLRNTNVPGKAPQGEPYSGG
ncbi:MAG TPA: c-type cytochrome [Polyangiales bacterium]|nr:c-type cytochrome [Polyangiales bacterium]